MALVDGALQSLQLAFLAGFGIGGGQPGGGVKLGRVSSAAGFPSQSDGQMGLAHPGRADEDDALAFFDEVSLTQIQQAFLVELGDGGEVEVGDLLGGGESGLLESPLTGFEVPFVRAGMSGHSQLAGPDLDAIDKASHAYRVKGPLDRHRVVVGVEAHRRLLAGKGGQLSTGGKRRGG